MLTAACHCGAVTLEVKRAPRTLTDCNCSICRRYGALWAYYRSVRIICQPEHIESYSWGRKTLRFFRCGVCGCITHHERTKQRSGNTVGVNARNMDPGVVASTRIRRLDGAKTWRYFD